MPTEFRCWDLDADPKCEEEGTVVPETTPEHAAAEFVENNWGGNDHPTETRVRVENEDGERADYVVTAEPIIHFSARRA
jgi:hypothetical protein